ncbi:MAG: TatD family hydrolase [Rhodothalassiaceae bacterium]
MLVDSHCHLTYEGLREDIAGILARAAAAGVGTLVTIATRLSDHEEIVRVSERFANVFATVGVHPHEAEAAADLDPHALVLRATHPKVIGIGETGLDYYYDNSPRAAQRGSFATHIAAAQETGLPLIVHSREAEEDSTRMLAAARKAGPLKAVIHCFTGSRAFMERMVDLGFSISISGIVTFRSARDLQETVKAIPEDRLLLETDSPFLAPVPHRGKRCEPAFVADTARFVAGLRGVSLDDLAATTTANFFRLFDKADGEGSASCA